MDPLRFVLIAFALLQACAPSGADTLAFWDRPQRGANSFNGRPPDEPYFRALRSYGATWVRLAFDKWPTARRDFLLGDADAYDRLDGDDLKVLVAALHRAHAAGLKVVVTPLSLPGARSRQRHGNEYDDRIWTDKAYWDQSARFWRDLAVELKDHPAVAGYNLINEPAPERRGGLPESAAPDAMQAWYDAQRGGTRDLFALYESVIAAIRKVDAHTPIMLDSGFHGSPSAYRHLPAPVRDAAVLYAYHMYEPWTATSARNLRREKPYAYPGVVPDRGVESHWDAARLARVLRYPVDWAREHGVAPNRLVAAEFGCMRRWESCPRYLDDVLTVLEEDAVHWAFYAFREDVWDGMDYELGVARVPWQYWDAVEAGEDFPLERRPNPVFEPITRRLRGAAFAEETQ